MGKSPNIQQLGKERIMLFTIKEVQAKKAIEKAYLEKLQKNRKKAAMGKKAYWQNRIDEFFLNGVIK
jgi:hypothetical protein